MNTFILFQIVLLICEYLIVVETNFGQNKKLLNRSRFPDLPIADKLDRKDFGFDQAYYERMPLLINALQEDSHIQLPADNSAPIWVKRQSNPLDSTTTKHYIRRTSPRPFISEYLRPYPRPFGSFNNGPQSWVESYHNTERVKNLHEVVKYLEKTLNAKFGDLYTPSETQFAFSSIYVAPWNHVKPNIYHSNSAVEQRNPRFELKSNHHLDALNNLRPKHPEEINLLADGMKYDSYLSNGNNKYEHSNIVTMLTSYGDSVKKCATINCNANNNKIKDSNVYASSELNNFVVSNNKSNSMSVLLDLYKNKIKEAKYNIKTSAFNPDTIDLTTSRPLVHFRKKSVAPKRRLISIRKRRPDYKRKIFNNTNSSSIKVLKERTTTAPKMFISLDVLSINNKDESQASDHKTEKSISLETTTFPSNIEATRNEYVRDFTKVDITNVEDYHVGSSGVLPVTEIPTPATYRITTPIVPPYIPTTSLPLPTIPPEILKFSPEDAKIPDQYLNWRKSDLTTEYFKESDSFNERDYEFPNFGEKIKSHKDAERTLVIKLQNSVTTTTETTTTSDDATEQNVEEISQTYVPQINGHYRNIRHKSLNTLLKENSEKYRKKIESLVRKSTYVPMYVEIQRNYTNVKDN